MVDVLLGLLGPGPGLQLALLHGLGVAVLLLLGEGELVCELLAEPGVARLAGLHLHLQVKDIERSNRFIVNQCLFRYSFKSYLEKLLWATDKTKYRGSKIYNIPRKHAIFSLNVL